MITRKDIAEKLGVSVSVVSRALNNSGYVSREKRLKILETANELGYYPNPIAMSLQQKKTKQIIFYCKDLNNAFNIDVYKGLLDEADKYGYTVLMNGRFNFQNIPRLLIDGVILPNDSTAAQYIEIIGKNYRLPAVTASYGDEVFLAKPIPRILSDLYEGMKKILEYLKDKGHKKIGMISSYSFYSKHARTLAWIDFVKHELELDYKKNYIGISKNDLLEDSRIHQFLEERVINSIDVWESYYEKGILAADIFNERALDVTAIVAFNDEMALGFCKRIKELGYKVPYDISIVGIDGIDTGEINNPRLTTLKINTNAMGSKCFTELLDIINNRKKKNVIYVETELIEKDSVRDLNK